MIGRMTSILDKIVERKKREVAEARKQVGLAELESRLLDQEPARDFFGALADAQTPGQTRVIAEIKRKSPSAGEIWKQPGPFDPVLIARSYHAAGATAISCLTDAVDFGGDLAFIAAIREAVPLPVLRKDFVVDEYQIWEARAAGADAVLLIAECIDPGMILELRGLAHRLGMSVLVEIHSEENLRAVLETMPFPEDGRTLLGINNRDLTRMETDIGNTARLIESVGDAIETPTVLVGESGIRTPADLARLRESEVRIVLVGEHLMSQTDPGAALKELLA
jgi:indole-3-glycerol phosphate synthase